MLVLGYLTQVTGHQEEEERSQMIGWDPKTEVGTSSPSAEVNNKKGGCLAGFVAGRRTIAIYSGLKTKEYLSHEGPQLLQASVKK